MENVELSIVMPCLNEAETIGTCIDKANRWIAENNIAAEVVIGNNGSTDQSKAIALSKGARVIDIAEQGYGNALIGAINAAKGKYVIMGDSDDSYDFSNLNAFYTQLKAGNDLVMGNRFKGVIKPGAMPFLHRYLGNPLLSFIGRLFFGSTVGDFHCGLRGFRQDIIQVLNLRTTGMEFASEMVVKATIFGLKVTEVPTSLSPDGGTRQPHLRTWRDGWRHLRFLLIYSPRWLFLYPGAALIIIGFIMGAMLAKGPLIVFGNVVLDTNTLIYAGASVIVGFQSICFALFSSVYAVDAGFLPAKDTYTKWFNYLSLEAGLITGAGVILAGVAGTFYSFYLWGRVHFGELNYEILMRIILPSVVAIIIGFQVILASFFLSVLMIKKQK